MPRTGKGKPMHPVFEKYFEEGQLEEDFGGKLSR